LPPADQTREMGGVDSDRRSSPPPGSIRDYRDVVPLMMYVFILPAGGRFNQETCRPRDQSDRDRLIRENLSRLSQT
jgi:hypothetical protein